MTTSTTTPAPAGAARTSRRPGGAGKIGQSTRDRVLGYLLITPVLSITALVIAFPLVSAIVTSFRDERIIGTDSQFVGLETFARVMSDSAFWDALGRSGIWLILNLLVQTVLAFTAALLLRRKGWWSRTARTWIVLPWVIPTVAVAVIWQWLLNSNYGIVYKIIEFFGIPLGSPFGNASTALIMVILVNSWHWFPLGAVVIYGGLATIPEEINEAARMDGANAWQAFWRVTFPLLQPVLFALGLVGSLWSVNILDSIYLITEGGPAGATTTMPVFVYDTAFSAFRSSQAAAASVLTVIILAIAAMLFVRLARPKEAE